MFVDFLISLWVGVLGFLTSSLPEGIIIRVALPPVVADSIGLMSFYIDSSPFAVLFSVLSGLLMGLIIYKAVNMIFNWISGLL